MTSSGTVALRGEQRPRIEWLPPDGEEHPDGDEVIEFAEALGVRLDPWQEYVLRASLRRAGGKWAAFSVGLCVPRQNGKNGITEIRELAGACLLGEGMVIHSAHLADTSKEAFRRIEYLIEANEWLSRDVKHIWRTNGHEAIEFRNGSRIRFRTRTKGGGRGFSGDCIVFDEAMDFPEASLGAILPVVSARPDPQIWYAGSAVDQLVHENGVVFSRVRARAIARNDPRLAYFEWSIDADNPDLVTPEQSADPSCVAQANPALGIRIDLGYVEDERRELPARTQAVERMGVWDPPDPDGATSVIDLDVWDLLEDHESEPLSPLWFSLDVSPDRARAAISVAGRRKDGRFHVEVVETGKGTGWLVGRCASLKAKHDPAGFVCDASGPVASLLEPLLEAGVEVETVTAQEHARACGFLFDAVEDKTVRHRDSPELKAAIRSAATRPLGDAWAWTRRGSRGDITPLVSSTLALGKVAIAVVETDPVVIWA